MLIMKNFGKEFKMKKMVFMLILTVFAFSSVSYGSSSSCSCGNVYCDILYDGCDQAFNPHTEYEDYNVINTEEVIDTNVLRFDNIGFHENTTGSPQWWPAGTVSISITEYENKTLSAGSATGVEATAAAEASFYFAKASVSGTWSFEVSGSYSTQQGVQISDSQNSIGYCIDPGKGIKTRKKMWGTDCSVTNEARKEHTCEGTSPCCDVYSRYIHSDHNDLLASKSASSSKNNTGVYLSMDYNVDDPFE